MSWSECCGCAMAFYAACQGHMMVQYCCDSGSSNKLNGCRSTCVAASGRH